jgi:hypothetical protein
LDTKADALKHFTSQTFGEIVRKLFDAVDLEGGELTGVVVGPEPVELDEDVLRTVGQLLVDGEVVGALVVLKDGARTEAEMPRGKVRNEQTSSMMRFKGCRARRA